MLIQLMPKKSFYLIYYLKLIFLMSQRMLLFISSFLQFYAMDKIHLLKMNFALKMIILLNTQLLMLIFDLMLMIMGLQAKLYLTIFFIIVKFL